MKLRSRTCAKCEQSGEPCYMHSGAGLSAPQVCTAAGVTYRQLDYWARTGLVKPSLSEAHGAGTQRRYSVNDLRVVFAVKRLLDLGVSLQSIRPVALGYLRDPEGCRWLVMTWRICPTWRRSPRRSP